MKNSILILFLVGLLTSCGTSKVERQAQKTFKGDWTLTNVELPSALVDVDVFDDADHRCFEGSNWHFVPNNNTGTYELVGDDCSPDQRKFFWNIQENTDNGEYSFTLKPEAKAAQARKQKSGYRLKLMYLDDTRMTWEQTVTYEGSPFTIKMNFSKN